MNPLPTTRSRRTARLSRLPALAPSPTNAPAGTVPAARSAAFTLIELLTVIAIIAILMALLFPAIMGAKEAARRTQASNDVSQIVAAVKSYYTEYGRYPDVQPAGATPPTGSGTPPDDLVGDKSIGGPVKPVDDNKALFYTLRAIDALPNSGHALNPRRLVFFEGKQASNPASPKGGFQPANGAGGGAGSSPDSYFDPWGKQYFVVMDSNYDNMLDVPYTDFAKGSGTTSNAPRVGVGAFSLGKDNQLGNKGDLTYKVGTTKSDDIISWQ